MKKKRKPWFPNSRPKQTVIVKNVLVKIPNYTVILELSAGKEQRILLVCETFLTMFDYLEQTRATYQQLMKFADFVFDGKTGESNNAKENGAPLPETPTFTKLSLPTEAFSNIVGEFRVLMEDVKNSDNYTVAIGKDLMIEPPEGEDLNLDELTAEGKVTALADSGMVRISGSLQGMRAMRVEWREKGSQKFLFIGQLDKLPGEVEVPAENLPVSGEIRLSLMENNERIGNYSPNYPLTVS